MWSDHPAIDKWVDALEATLETSNERIRMLESRIVLDDAGIAANMAEVDNREGCIKKAEAKALVMTPITRKPGLLLPTAKAAHSSAEAAFRLAESQLQDVCASESSMLEEVSQLLSDEAHIEGQCELRLGVVVVHTNCCSVQLG